MVEFEINDFPDIDDKALTVTVNLFLGMEWPEPRLIILEPKDSDSAGQSYAVNLQAMRNNLLWKPDLFISHLVDYKELKV